jgi:hypothetical protein
MAKYIRFSVGRSGRNASADDVVTVQYLLNCVPESLGGPKTELATTGVADEATIAAIARFQTFSMQLATGRVDEDGETLARLQVFDPYPGMAVSESGGYEKHILGTVVGARRLMGPPKIGEATSYSSLRGAGAFVPGGASAYHLENAWPAKLKSDGPIKFPPR